MKNKIIEIFTAIIMSIIFLIIIKFVDFIFLEVFNDSEPNLIITLIGVFISFIICYELLKIFIKGN